MARASQDVIGFRRIFVLYCTLVLLPAILMSGFAVVAIRNERQAEQTRVRERAQTQLQGAEKTFVSLVDRIDQRVRDAFTEKREAPQMIAAAAALRKANVPLGPWAHISDDGQVLAGEPPLLVDGDVNISGRVRTVIKDLNAKEAAHLNASEVGPSWTGHVLGLVRLPGSGVVAFIIDRAKFDAQLEQQVIVEEPFEFIHRVVSEEEDPSPIGALSTLVRQVIPADEDGPPQGRVEVVSSQLKPPFERSTLVVTAPPTGATATVTYIILLLIFISVLITGVVITSRLIWRETKISRLKTDFVSHVSHELRTPLTSIRMFIETLRRGRASKEEEEECLDLLTTETERLSEMIERVLGYARLQAGRRQFQRAPERPIDLVEDALEAFRASVISDERANDLELTVAVDKDLPFVLVDKSAVSEALLNLIGNAYKYTGQDKRIHVFASHRRKRVVISVKDNGPGLPKSEHKRVFDRFYQAGNLLSRKAQGSGLGLAITRGIIEGQGGKIGVVSEIGKGSTFFVELRVAEDANA